MEMKFKFLKKLYPTNDMWQFEIYLKIIMVGLNYVLDENYLFLEIIIMFQLIILIILGGCFYYDEDLCLKSF